MEEEQSVEVEETTEESQPETNTEEVEASDEDTSSEETEETAETEPAKPKKSRASERIRELIAQKKALEAQLRQKEPEIEGVDETGIDPNKFADSLEKRISQKANSIAQSNFEYYKAEQEFPMVKQNNLVRSRAGDLVDQGYSPIQAAEIATLEWQEATGQEVKKVQRKQAASNLRAGAQISQAGKKISASSSFTRNEIAKMTPSEYVKNQAAIQAQLEKYGPESFE